MKNIFRGLGIALITPFKKDGSIDFDALANIVNIQISKGIDFLCVLGTTAETPCLSQEERKQVQDFIVKINQDRVPILLGCGGNNTKEVGEFLKNADFTGVDGVLLVCPFYNKPTQEGLYLHFKTLSKASPLPIVLYNVPGRTGVNLSAKTTISLAKDCDNIIAIKEASGNIMQIDEIIANAPIGFDVLSGDDAITMELISSGAKGVISVIGNAYPKEFGNMVHHLLNNKPQEARKIHQKFLSLYRLLSVNGNPAGIKTFMSVLNKCENILRLPLIPAQEQTRNDMITWVKENKDFFIG